MLGPFGQRRLVYSIFLFTFIFIVFVIWPIMPPFNFPVGSVFTVPDGAGLNVVAEKLKRENIIRSSFWFRVIAIMLGGERDMKIGEYYLSRPQSTPILVWRILNADHGAEVVKITIPEGFSVRKIADLFDTRFPFFDRDDFIRTAPEGYLFPDTYFVPVTATTPFIIKLFRDNFSRKITSLLDDIKSSGKTLEEIVIMASIIETEARSREDREIISGILWKRLALGMPLQVDASFSYINGKTTKDLTAGDLKIDSPFNTYLYSGLPPTPIANPGLESIMAAIHPTTTPFLYFLTGDDGKMYYSKTLEEHARKKRQFIKNN